MTDLNTMNCFDTVANSVKIRDIEIKELQDLAAAYKRYEFSTGAEQCLIDRVVKEYQKYNSEFLDMTPEEFWSFLEKEFWQKNLSTVRDLFNVMCEYKRFNHPLLLLMVSLPEFPRKDAKADDYEFDWRYYVQVIMPYTALIKEMFRYNIDWDILRYVEYCDDFGRLKTWIQEQHSTEGLNQFLKYNLKKEDVKLYCNAIKYIDKDELDKATNKTAYLKSCRLLFREDFPDVTEKYHKVVPEFVLSTLLVLAHIGYDVTRLDDYLSMFKDQYTWRNVCKMHDVIFEKGMEVITEQHLDNLYGVARILTGHPDCIKLGGDAVADRLRILAASYYVKDCYVTPKTNKCLSDFKKLYISSLKCQYAFLESTAPFIWERVDTAIRSLLMGEIITVKIDRKIISTDMTASYAVTIGLKEQPKPIREDQYSTYPITRMLANSPLNGTLELLQFMHAVGNKVNCHDWYFCFIAAQLLNEGLPTQYWFKLFLSNPLAYNTSFFKMVVAYKSGAEDYKDLLEDTENGYQRFFKIADNVAIQYNRMSALVLKFAIRMKMDILQFKTSLRMKPVMYLYMTRELIDSKTLKRSLKEVQFTITIDDLESGILEKDLNRAIGHDVDTEIKDNILYVRVKGVC